VKIVAQEKSAPCARRGRGGWNRISIRIVSDRVRRTGARLLKKLRGGLRVCGERIEEARVSFHRVVHRKSLERRANISPIAKQHGEAKLFRLGKFSSRLL